MRPAAFDYKRPETLDEALDYLDRYGDDAKLLAGGHSLLPTMKLRVASPAVLVDLSHIKVLQGITTARGELTIGGFTTHHEIESSPMVREHCPLLAETASMIGDVQVRNRGTIGGSLAHNDPSADYPAAVLALDAALTVAGPDGERRMPVSDLFTGPMMTALRTNEVIKGVHLSSFGSRTGGSYQKVARRASDFAVVGVAAVVTLAEDQTIEKAAVALTGVDLTAVRAPSVEQTLVGQAPGQQRLKEASNAVKSDIHPDSDVHATAEYRSHLAAVYTQRALNEAVERAQA